MLKISWKAYYIFTCLILTPLLVNFFVWKNINTSVILGVIYILYFGLFFGHLFFTKYKFIPKLFFGILMIFAYFMIFGSISYYLFVLSNIFISLILIFAPLFLGLKLVKDPLVFEFSFPELSFIVLLQVIFSAIYLFLCYIQFHYFISKAIEVSINSPWQALSPNVFFLYGISTLILIFLLLISRNNIFIFFVSLHYFLSFCVIIFVYKLGFGYDPYLHQASEKLMMQVGTFSPKPFYYLGQYSLVVILSKIFAQSVVLFDRLLVPIVASLFLPIVIYQSLKENLFIKDNVILLSVLSFLLIPFANFTYTTPQSLANIFVLITIFLAISFINYRFFSIWPLLILSIATCFIHPLSGLPLVVFVILTWVYHMFEEKGIIKTIFKNLVFWIIAISSCFALPVAFWFYSLIKKIDISSLEQMTGNNLLMNLVPANIFWPRFVNFFDLVYLYGRNINLVILLVSIIGIIFVIYYKQLKNYFTYLLMFFILIINYLIVITYIKFPFLSDFSERIFNLSFYFLLPFFMVGLVLFIKSFVENKHIFRIFVFVFLSLFLSISFYFSYPKVDKYENFHGYSMSDTHIKTVDYIEQNFDKRDYVVLGDQTLGATVISKYGFRKYYKNEFYYSLPTKIKDNIYADFLEMTKEETDKKEAAINTAKKVGVNTVFVVLNDYWEFTDKLIDEHKKLASNWVEVDSGKAYIFEYNVPVNY